jgi:hypothetical protein
MHQHVQSSDNEYEAHNQPPEKSASSKGGKRKPSIGESRKHDHSAHNNRYADPGQHWKKERKNSDDYEPERGKLNRRAR